MNQITRQLAKEYLINYINGNSTRIKGIGNHLRHRNPELLEYIKKESKKFGFSNNGIVIYMLLNDIETPPLCVDCKINYTTFYNHHFNKRCTKCGLKHGGIQSNQSYKEKHGHYLFSDKEFRDKISDKLFKETGYKYNTQKPEVISKIQKSLHEKYNGCGFASQHIKDKIDSTMISKYGYNHIDYNGNSKRISDMKSRNIQKYGVDSWMKLDSSKKLFHNMNMTKEILQNVIDFLNKYDLVLVSNYYNAKTPFKVKCNKCKNEFWIKCYNQMQQGIISPYCCKNCYPNIGSGKSQTEISISNSIQLKYPNLKIETNIRNIIDNHKELDIYIKEKNLAIEYNGLWWHSSNNCNPKNRSIDSDYHYKKYKMCKEKGIRLITIFEWDSLDIIMNIIYHIIDDNEIIDLNNFEKIDGTDDILIDNRFYSYEFLKNKNNYELIRKIQPLPWFWEIHDRDFIRYDEFKQSFCTDGSKPFDVAKEYDYNWIYDCGYQVIRLKTEKSV